MTRGGTNSTGWRDDQRQLQWIAFKEYHLRRMPGLGLYADGKPLTMETSLDTDLQRHIMELLRRSMTQQGAVVVLRP